MEHETIRFHALPVTKALIQLHLVFTTREAVRPKMILHPHEATNQMELETIHPLLPTQAITTVDTIILAQAEGDLLPEADANHI